MTEIYIQGCGLTPFAEHYDQSLTDILYQACDQALESAQIDINNIDSIVVGSMLCGSLNQQSQLNSAISARYNINIPIIRVEAACASGGMALWNACQLLKSGQANNVLVVGIEKMTDHDTHTNSQALLQAASPDEQLSGINFPGLYAIMARKYLQEYSLTEQALAKVSVLMHQHAASNPNAQFRNPITVDDVLNSPEVASPLKLLDCSPISDGAAAIILSTEDKQQTKMQIKESILTTDTANLCQRPTLTSIPAATKAWQQLQSKTNITNQEIAVAELHDCFSIALLIALEDLGFAKPGQAYTLLDQSDLTINPSGGLKACGHPVGATGIKQIIEVYNWLQSNQKQYGLCHNIGGTGGTCVLTLIEHAIS